MSGYVTSSGSASSEELGAYFEQFGMVPGSLEMKTSPTASRDGGGHFAFFTVRSPAAATELLTLSHVLHVHGEEARLRVKWATNQKRPAAAAAAAATAAAAAAARAAAARAEEEGEPKRVQARPDRTGARRARLRSGRA